jgi:cell pole-organizing protein PopZ
MNTTYERNPNEESSMEDILSSIRQILASDDEPYEKAAPTKSAASHKEDVIELTEVVPVFHAATSAPEVASTKKEENPIMTIPAQQEAKIISQKTVEAANHSLSKLTEALHPAQTHGPVQHHTVGGSVTLEALVSHAMQPILREWMDQNLPQVIENVVASEIKKLVRQAT